MFTSGIACCLLLWSATAFTTNSEKQPGIIIPDAAPYPLYQYSKIELSESEQLPSLHLNYTGKLAKKLLMSALHNLGIPFEQAANSDEIKTGWISWHYDKESKQSQSKPRNSFFSQNFRDRYRFKFIVSTSENYSDIRLKKVERSEEQDITPDTEYIWTEWREKQPDKNAIYDFLQRLQTEFEKQMLSEKSEPSPLTSKPTNKPGTNHILLNISVESAWNNLIKALSTQAIPIASSHDNQHMLYTDWVSAEYDTMGQTLPQSHHNQQRHQFQIIVIPGSVHGSSSVYVYHTAFQQLSKANLGANLEASWVNADTNETVASRFLSTLKLNQ